MLCWLACNFQSRPDCSQTNSLLSLPPGGSTCSFERLSFWTNLFINCSINQRPLCYQPARLQTAAITVSNDHLLRSSDPVTSPSGLCSWGSLCLHPTLASYNAFPQRGLRHILPDLPTSPQKDVLPNTPRALHTAKKLPLKDGFRFCCSSTRRTAGAEDCPEYPLICLNPKHQMVTAICFSKLILQRTQSPPWACQHPGPELGGANYPPDSACQNPTSIFFFKRYLLPAGDSDPSLLIPSNKHAPDVRTVFQQAPDVRMHGLFSNKPRIYGMLTCTSARCLTPSTRCHSWPDRELAKNLPKHLVGSHSNAYSYNIQDNVLIMREYSGHLSDYSHGSRQNMFVLLLRKFGSFFLNYHIS